MKMTILARKREEEIKARNLKAVWRALWDETYKWLTGMSTTALDRE